MDSAANTIIRRDPQDSILHKVIRDNLETFLDMANADPNSRGLPRYVEKELKAYLK